MYSEGGSRRPPIFLYTFTWVLNSFPFFNSRLEKKIHNQRLPREISFRERRNSVRVSNRASAPHILRRALPFEKKSIFPFKMNHLISAGKKKNRDEPLSCVIQSAPFCMRWSQHQQWKRGQTPDQPYRVRQSSRQGCREMSRLESFTWISIYRPDWFSV